MGVSENGCIPLHGRWMEKNDDSSAGQRVPLRQSHTGWWYIYPSKPPTSIYPVCLDFCLVLMAFTEGVRAAGPWGTQRSSRVLRENLRAQYFMNTPFTLFVANTLLWHLAHPLQSGSFGITLDIIIWITRASCFVFPNHIASREASRSPICQVQMWLWRNSTLFGERARHMPAKRLILLCQQHRQVTDETVTVEIHWSPALRFFPRHQERGLYPLGQYKLQDDNYISHYSL